MVLTLYKLDASPPVRAVFMTLDILGIDDVEMVDVNLLTADHLKDEFTKMNPQHTVPTLTDDDFVIWDSHAITTYLVNKYAANNPIYPNEPKIRALIDQKLHFDSGILFPALRTTVEPVIFLGEKAFKSEHLAKIKAAYGYTDKFLAKTPWLAGNEMTLADICCVATISSLNIVLPIDETLYPNLTAWLDNCAATECYKKCNMNGNVQAVADEQDRLKTKVSIDFCTIAPSNIEYPNIAAWLKKFASKDFYKKHNEAHLEKLKEIIKSKLA